MEKNYETSSFKKLLNRLQEDSWQLELLISGFAIFGLFYALDPIGLKLQAAQFDNNKVFVIVFIIINFSVQILIFNLLLHIIFRGLWIGSLGLRYVFGDIDFDKLNYNEKFTKYLKNKVGSFDSYINKLENFCSVIFSISFLLVFYISSFFILTSILILFQNPVPVWAMFVIRLLFVFFALGVILTFFDFITLGLLKKNKWVARIYFPFYRVFSILTLSFLYRPLVYNLLDNKNGRRISFGLIPFYFLIYVFFNLYYQKSNFITPESTKLSTDYIANSRNYEDVIEKNDNVFIGEFAIQSKVITEPFVKIIVPLSTKIEDVLFEFNSDLKPENDKRGLLFQPTVSFIEKTSDNEIFDKAYLNTFTKCYSIKIDTSLYKTEFVITNNKNQLGFEAYIGIDGLPEGKHTIEFQRLIHQNTDSLVSIRKFPFWYFKE